MTITQDSPATEPSTAEISAIAKEILREDGFRKHELGIRRGQPHCIGGALNHALARDEEFAHDDGGRWRHDHAAMRVYDDIWSVIRKRHPEQAAEVKALVRFSYSTQNYIAMWNNRPDVTKADVMSVLAEAAAP